MSDSEYIQDFFHLIELIIIFTQIVCFRILQQKISYMNNKYFWFCTNI